MEQEKKASPASNGRNRHGKHGDRRRNSNKKFKKPAEQPKQKQKHEVFANTDSPGKASREITETVRENIGLNNLNKKSRFQETPKNGVESEIFSKNGSRSNSKKTYVAAHVDEGEFEIDTEFLKRLESLDAEEEFQRLTKSESGSKNAETEIQKVEVVGIRFKTSGKVYYFAPGSIKTKKGDFAIVETARGQEFGEVALGNAFVRETDIIPPLRPVIRIATPEDHAHNAENKEKEKEAFKIAAEKISMHKLEMKLIEAQFQAPLLFYLIRANRFPRACEGPCLCFQNENRAEADRNTRRGKTHRRTRNMRQTALLCTLFKRFRTGIDKDGEGTEPVAQFRQDFGCVRQAYVLPALRI